MDEMVLEYIHTLLVGDGMLLVAVAFVVGQVIKTSLDQVPNKYIPLVCAVIGAVIGAVSPHFFPSSGMFTSALKGMVISWAATGGYEMMRNLKEEQA